MPDPSLQPGVSDGCGVAVYRQWLSGTMLFFGRRAPNGRDEPGRWFPEAEAAALVDVADVMVGLLEEAHDMAGWGDVTLGATQQHRVFSAVAKIAQEALDRLDAARSPA